MGLKNFALKKLGKRPGYQEVIRGKLNPKWKVEANVLLFYL